jgi:hypothetical protein
MRWALLLLAVSCASPTGAPVPRAPLEPARGPLASPQRAPIRPAEQGDRKRGEELLRERLAYCDLDGIPAVGGRVAALGFRGVPPADEREGFVIHAERRPGATEWRAVMLHSETAVGWERGSSGQELIIHHGRLTGRALILSSASDGRIIELRALSYTDSGPPFEFHWSDLHAELRSSRETLDLVGDGWVFVSLRGRYDFEGQGLREGGICAVVKTTLRPGAAEGCGMDSAGCREMRTPW